MKREWPTKRASDQGGPLVPPPVRPKAILAESILAPKPRCTDCGSATRKLHQVSPKVLLCLEDIRKRKKAKKAAAQARRVERVYGITLEQKAKIIEAQGGGCICSEWTGYNGNTRALSVDHDHKTGVIRGVLCKHCNDLLGRIRDDPEYLFRMIHYLANPPAVRLFGKIIAPEG